MTLNAKLTYIIYYSILGPTVYTYNTVFQPRHYYMHKTELTTLYTSHAVLKE